MTLRTVCSRETPGATAWYARNLSPCRHMTLPGSEPYDALMNVHPGDHAGSVAGTHLRPMRPADIEPATQAILGEDWGDRRTWFEFAVSHRECRVFVADDGAGRILGTAVATLNGRVAWIGTIWVAAAARRRGLGRALTEATIEAAEAAGSRTLVLVATDAGRRLYERLGFAVQTWYRTMEAPGLAVPTLRPNEPRVRAFRPEDIDALAALDRSATGEDRRHLLEAFAAPASTRVAVDRDDSARGFVMRAPWGGGATVAATLDDARAILHARRVAAGGPERRVRCGILLENTAGAAALEADGWTEAWRAPRLVRGAPLEWHPDRIWGQFNHALG